VVERFSWAQVNHHLWRRQGFSWEPEASWRDVLEKDIGLYATSPTCYLTVLARAVDFRFPYLNEYIVVERRAVRIRAMRYSNFIIPVSLLPAIYQARKTDRANPIQQIVSSGMSVEEYEEVAQLIEDLLSDGSRRTAGEIKKALPIDGDRYGVAFSYVIPQMCEEGRLVRAGARGGWKSDLYEYARFDGWLPGVDLNETTPQAGQAVLARLYFDSYGPATSGDFRWWSGLSKDEAGRAVDSLGSELARIQVDGLDHWLSASRLDELRSCPAELPRGVRLLPVWDAYLMAYRDRGRYLPEEWYGYVYAGTGDATSTLLLDGAPGGVWDFQEEKKRLVVKVALFREARQGVWDEIRDQVVRLAEVTGYSSAVLLRCQAQSLKEGPRNRFRSPLKDAVGEMVFEL
jgi:hypothetical protein